MFHISYGTTRQGSESGGVSPRAAVSERILSGVASAPRFFQRGLTPKNRGADAAPLRGLITDRARCCRIASAMPWRWQRGQPVMNSRVAFVAASQPLE